MFYKQRAISIFLALETIGAFFFLFSWPSRFIPDKSVSNIYQTWILTKVHVYLINWLRNSKETQFLTNYQVQGFGSKADEGKIENTDHIGLQVALDLFLKTLESCDTSNWNF